MIKVYTEISHPRVEYAFSFLLGGIRLDWEYHEDLATADVVYSSEKPTSDQIWIHHEGIVAGGNEEFKHLYPTGKAIAEGSFRTDQGFDLIAFTFHVLSRMEEYEEGPRDEHGRYMYTESLLYKNDMLQMPVLDILQMKYFAGMTEQQQGDIDTMDVDTSFYYLGKKALVNYGRNISDLFQFRFKSFKERWKVRTGRQTDPYVQNLRDYIHQKPDAPKHVFWLINDKSQYDRQVPITYRKHQKFIIEAKNQVPVSLHASYDASTDIRVLRDEKALLEKIIESKINDNRFHYIRLILPVSYQNLLLSDIKHDWSMGYPEVNGFRAGTSQDFPWYDLSKEAQTLLTITPFSFMDIATDLPDTYQAVRHVKVYHNTQEIELE